MKLTRFVVERTAEGGAKKTVHIGVLDFEVTTGGCRIRNMRPFEIVIDKAGMIYNYSDRVMVSINDKVNRVIRVDTMSVLSIANHADVQHELGKIAQVDKLVELDTVLLGIDQLNAKVRAYVQEVEMECILEDLLAMNRAHAIDMALDAGDVETFNKLTEVQQA